MKKKPKCRHDYHEKFLVVFPNGDEVVEWVCSDCHQNVGWTPKYIYDANAVKSYIGWCEGHAQYGLPLPEEPQWPAHKQLEVVYYPKPLGSSGGKVLSFAGSVPDAG